HVHLNHRCDQCLLAALVALEDARLETALAVLRDPQHQLAHPRLEGSRLVTVTPPAPLSAALVSIGADELIELTLDGFLDQPLHHGPQQVLGGSGPALSATRGKISVREKGHRRSPGLLRARTRCERGVNQKIYGGLSPFASRPLPPL